MFSHVCKSGLVTLLLKKPGLVIGDYKNFCPITNLSIMSKIMECQAIALLKPHISASSNYCWLQSAYQAVVDDIMSVIDSGSAVALIAHDISAAFNMAG